MLSDFEKKVGPTMSYGDGNKGQTLDMANIINGNVIIENVALVEGLEAQSAKCEVGFVTKAIMWTSWKVTVK